jgi:hypothetical protein
MSEIAISDEKNRMEPDRRGKNGTRYGINRTGLVLIILLVIAH